MLDVAVPCLGEMFDAYSARLGAPEHTAVLAGCIVRRYSWRSSTLSVLFIAGRSVALHCAYPQAETDQPRVPALLFSLHALNPLSTSVLCGTTGALLISPACPHAAIEALDNEPGSRRPRLVRECIELRDFPV